ncbi:hypothetical protein [Pseudoalteromonas denitrificans]|uniref:DUF4878 domain-containing protein n=1 Tax=Pseudoalteromonas denitrificans DSM 6059 TaxID=1123010 RepID=A0A1I1UD79_9GAMM|nr:hypothetical protein [Pseudoalteromonas denitrificans]SFD68644.1 hypothetical protein SAMN02745724_05193 [Pseudoalteromonas denitrificans DSM 6059]
MYLFRSFLTACLALFLSACSDDNAEVSGDNNSPEYTATVFFYAIYEEKDLKKTMSLSTPKLARIIKSYGSTRQFARNLINMQFDKVNIEIDRTSKSIRKRYGDKATITLIFSGTFNGRKVDDMRSVKLIQKKGKWFIEKIVDDPYAR